ncbi:MAG TPA: M4 family metallopeptidase, partial [Cryomorphaceae bacterium]|nr:M4 family metallopeptidase [Cryomorphaceae bacterium]
MKLIAKLMVTGLIAANTITAQTFTGSDASQFLENANKIVLNPSDGTVKYCSFEKPIPFDDKAIDEIKRFLNFVPKSELEEVGRLTDKLGITHVKYEQTFEGIPIQGAILSFHVKDGLVISFSGDYKLNLQLSTSAAISELEAIGIARESVKSDTYRESDKPDQVIYSTGSESVLTYQVDVFGLSPLVRKYVFVNAQTGEIVDTHERIHEVEAEGEAETLYSGTRTIVTDSTASGFRLNDYSRGGGIITYDMNGSTFYGAASEITDSDNFWEEEDHSADAALDAHWGTEVTYDYFLNVHGRDSYDGEGASINSYVDYDFSYSNAFWNGEAMTYGSGGGGDNPFPAIDVVAHEIVHGLTEYSAGLIYAYESGALNESFSDIFGIVIDFTARGEEYANYEMGEEIRTPPIRSMSNPNLLESPDTYQGNYWVFGSFDNGGVHFNSGVQNYWFYLLVEGGSGTNDNDDDYSVQSIGLEAAADIAFRNLTVYLGPNSQYEDARTFSIQSAIDLYGECSDEVIAVTNAWHAVGVGDTFDNAVIADFNYSNNYYCQVPAIINFGNLSSNSSSYLWSFGDGNTSDEENPSHTYTEAGVYTVTLEVTGESECSDGDTLELVNLITVTDEGGPLSPSCTPSPAVTNTVSGISSFELLDISNSSGWEEGYEDFTCTHSTELIGGTIQTLTVEFFNTEYLHLWIDLDADGSFSDEEKIYTPPAASAYHEVDFVVPGSSNLNEPLRLRVISSNIPNAQSCNIGQYGQAEDYTVILLGNEAPPVANFNTEDQVLQPSELIQFNDLSLNLPETWEWYFEGGSPESSTDQYPTVQYNSEGSFDVQLIVVNEFGADTLLMTDYISVVSSINLCEETSTTAISGLLYDSGGPDGNYSNNEFCTLLISPGCAQSITLSFEFFQLEGCCDYFRVYDGNDNTGVLILNENGFGIPANVTAESGEMFIQFSSDFSVTYGGWAANWTSETPTDNPVAEMLLSDENPALSEPIQFTDGSTNFPVTWQWDFGDGNTSMVQNPSHAYGEPGTYDVSLVVGNCFGFDTTVTEITVQGAPQFDISISDSLELSLSCGASVDTAFYIYNNGVGDLILNNSNFGGGSSTLQVLALTTHADLLNEYPNTLNAINAHFTDYNLSVSDALTAEELTLALDGIHVLLIPEQEYFGVNSFFSEISEPIVDFVENGGGLLICGNNQVGALGVFPTVDDYSSSFFPLSVANSDYSISEGVDLNFNASQITFTNAWGESEEVEPIVIYPDYPNYYAVAKQSLGEGNAIFCGFDYSSSEANAELLLANSLEYLSGFAQIGLIDSLSLAEQEIIEPGDSLLVFLSISAEEIFAGQYTETLFFETNDPDNALDSLQIQIEVTGQPLLSLQPESLNFGELIAGFSITDTVFVFNDGCADLLLDLSLESEGFELMGASSLTILPFSADTVLVTFSPQAAESYTGSLIISGNGGDASVDLTGEGVPAPEIEIIPADTLFVSVPCGTTSEDTFTIYNNGGSDLEVNLDQVPDGELTILALTAYADISQEYSNTLDAIDSHFEGYTLSEYSGTDMAVLSELLEEADILLIPEQEGSPSASFFTNITSTVLTYLENGGEVLTCGSDQVQNLGVFTPGFSNSYNTGTIVSIIPDHPVMEGIPSGFPASNATFSHSFASGSDVIAIAEHQGLNPIFEVEVGSGRMIYLGFDFYAYQDVHAQIIGNALSYLSTFTTGEVLFDTEFPLEIPASGSVEITVTTDAAGMLAGEYFTDLTFQTNDPENTTLDYVIAVEVTGQPLLSLQPESINFGELIAGFSITDTVFVFNDGCADLELDLSIDAEGFELMGVSSLTISPFSADTVLVAFSPQAAESYTGSLIISGNGGDASVDLTGEGVPAPEIEIIPADTLFVTVPCGTTSEDIFTIYNYGGSDLEVNLNQAPDGELNILALITYADISQEYSNTLEAIDLYFDGYTLTEYSGTDMAVLSELLEEADILLIPEQEGSANASFFTNITGTVLAYLENGGEVLTCGSEDVQNLGVFTPIFSDNDNGGTIVSTSPDHPVMEGIPSGFSAPNATFSHSFASGSDVITIAEYQ